MIIEKSISDVRERADIVEVISKYLPLKRAGRNYKSNCPFHEEKTPSFLVSDEKQLFKCFGCGVGGNVFNFLMQYEGVTFIEAVKILAKEYGVELIEDKKGFDKEKDSKEEMLNTLSVAARFFHILLEKGKTADLAREYLKKRKFKEEQIKHFMLGYSGKDVDYFIKSLKKKEIDELTLEKTGLILRNEDKKWRLRFYERIMFPIHDGQGRVIAFGARALKDKQMPKYLNSSDSLVFNKSRVFYGLHQARKTIVKEGIAILVEGYIDVIRLHEVGIKNVIAVLGTSLTNQHLPLLNRLAQEVIICFDADKAGELATLRAMETFLQGNIIVRVLRLPKNEDPDSIITKYGKEHFLDLAKQAPHMLDYKMNMLLNEFDINSELGKRNIVSGMLQSIVALQNHVSKEHHLNNLAKKININAEKLEQMMRELKKPSSPGGGNYEQSIKDVKTKIQLSEEMILGIVAKKPDIAADVMKSIKPDDFSLPIYQDLANWYFLQTYPHNDAEFSKMRAQLEIGELPDGDLNLVIDECLRNIEAYRLKRENDRIQSKLNDSDQLNNETKKLLEKKLKNKQKSLHK